MLNFLFTPLENLQVKRDFYWWQRLCFINHYCHDKMKQNPFIGFISSSSPFSACKFYSSFQIKLHKAERNSHCISLYKIQKWKTILWKVYEVISTLSCSKSCWHCLEIKSVSGIPDHYYFRVALLKEDFIERLWD